MGKRPEGPTEFRPGEPTTRFEATLHPGARELLVEEILALDLDRVPDREGRVRLLITADEAVGLVERGYEVHLHRALPVRPLDRSLIADDDAVRQWLEDRVRGIERDEGP